MCVCVCVCVCIYIYDVCLNTYIVVDIKCDKDFYSALSNNLGYFKNETLCMEINKVDAVHEKDNYLEIKIGNLVYYFSYFLAGVFLYSNQNLFSIISLFY